MRWLLLFALVGLTACSGFNRSDLYQTIRYRQFSDSAPEAPPNLDAIPDAIPKYEPKSAGGNKPVYTVRGKQYRVLDQADGFTQEGQASWYGQKFHGHKTSNGERYDMYSMSAAHKNLPLPSYVKVTRLDTGLHVIVRVNDRGPFHSGRIIDLSYAAAHRLGMLQHGTGKVRLEAITLPPPRPPSNELDAIGRFATNTDSPQVNPPARIRVHAPTSMKPASQSSALYVQVTVTRDQAKADHLVSQLAAVFEIGARSVFDAPLHKIQLGPFANEAIADELILQLKRGEFSSAFKVYP